MNETNKGRFELPLLLFDDQCELCKRFKLSLEKIPGTDHINMISVHEKLVYELYPELDYEQCTSEIHLLLDEDTTLIGSDAIEYLIKLFPLVEKFSWLIESNMGKKSIDYFNNMTSKYRQRLLKGCPGCKNKTHRR